MAGLVSNPSIKQIPTLEGYVETRNVTSIPPGPWRQGVAAVRKLLGTALAAVALVSLAGLAKSPANGGSATPFKLTAAASALPPSWKLVFNSNFSGTSPGGKVNPRVWTTCYPWALSSAGCTNYARVNAEQEWYLPSQVRVLGGVLHLTAARKATRGTNAQGRPKVYACRSGMVTTFRGFKFTYGFVQITARLPFGAGLWPAFWLAAANEKYPPEIDILEHWGNATISKLYLHPLNGPRQGKAYNTPTADSGWHTWRLYWTKTRLTWYYDGIQTYTTTKDIPHQPMYFIANLADTSTSAGACNGTLLVQSVKVWRP